MSIETNPSPSPSVETAVAPLARMLQIVHGSLVAGVTAFLAYVMWQGPRFADAPDAFPLIPLGFAALCVVLSVVIPPLVRQSGLAALRGNSPPSVESLFGPFSAAHIVGMAILESAGFLSAFTLMNGVFGRPPRWFLAVPIALLVLMVIRFPRAASVAEWVSSARDEWALRPRDQA